jgi:ubiquinone/menaquinone biosynthesis C-methylase UbiE
LEAWYAIIPNGNIRRTTNKIHLKDTHLLKVSPPTLKLLPRKKYDGVNEYDPINYYYLPIFGRMYRRRVELALGECRGGQRVLEVGFGAGAAFLNLNESYEEIHGIDLTAKIEIIKSVFEPMNLPLFLQNGNVLNIPYDKEFFDTVLLVSILEHLKTHELAQAFNEVRRVLKPGGQAIYGTPVDRPFMTLMFRLLGHNIRNEHFSTEKQIATAARKTLNKVKVIEMKGYPAFFGKVYEVGHFSKPSVNA